MNYKKIAVREVEKPSYTTKNSLLDKLLALRNIKTENEALEFLNPSKNNFISPYEYNDMKKAVERIHQAIKENQKILVWGDFDCDGVTSTTIVYKALKELEADVITFIPNRVTHGHGLNSKELLNFASKEKVKLVITVDCATSNIKEINLLKSFKIDTIVTDHHTIDDELPNAYAIINPQVKGGINENLNTKQIEYLTYNSGSVVAYKLAMALLENNNNQQLKDELLLIGSIGAIADVVPIIGENRAMVTEALKYLNLNHEKAHKGIYKLLRQNIKDRDFTSTDIAFILAPRINATGRLNSAELAFNFLTTNDDNQLNIIIEQLNSYNSIRQTKCLETYEEIKEYLKNNPNELNLPAIVLMNSAWHIGIIGIVASKIVEEFSKPCFLMTQDDKGFIRCSIRSNETINVYNVLKENQDLFMGFGGHKLAGGCSFDLSANSFE
ncbi:single-stranded-DNA-specific exonuclease RecJ, partial [bacterium]|nr:single-stranded-DNA-specific exonuclease RecJ [bacterium]